MEKEVKTQLEELKEILTEINLSPYLGEEKEPVKVIVKLAENNGNNKAEIQRALNILYHLLD
jgi:hypothetical protein